jgi:hypothetical protein
MRLWTFLLVAIVLSTVGLRAFGFGQSPSSPRPASGVVVGQVIDAGTGKGIGGALVTLSRIDDAPLLKPSNSSGLTLVATGDGRYAFRSLGAGRYTISASKPGYLSGGFGARRPGGMRQLLVLTEGEEFAASPITLWRHAVISGLVVDDAGEPVVGARVRVLRRTPLRGREFGGESSETTDDRGIYRISALPPGDYLVLVPSISIDGSLVYPTTFYPSALSPELAAIVTVASGDDRAGVDFQLTPASGVRVRGTIQDPNGPAEGVSVTLRWPDAELFPFDLEVATTVSGPDGSFSFNAVSGGTYLLEAAERPEPVNVSRGVPDAGEYGRSAVLTSAGMITTSSTLMGSSTVVVGDRNIDHFLLQLRPGARVTGRVTFEGGARSTPAPIAATSVYLDRLDERSSRTEPARPDRFGRFATTGLPAGRYRLRVGTIPTGWMFKAAMYEGHDIADEPFELESKDIDGVVVMFSTHGTRLSGVVRSERGEPDPETSVLIYPAIHVLWTPTISLLRMRSVRASTTGAYTATSLPPGEYYVVAVPEQQSSGWQDPKRLAELAPHATRIRIGEGQTQIQDLRTVRDR